MWIIGWQRGISEINVGRKKRSPIERVMTETWFQFVAKSVGSSEIPTIERALGWEHQSNLPKNKSNESSPSHAVLENVEKVFEGSGRMFRAGPKNVFAIMQADSIDSAAQYICSAIEYMCNQVGISIIETPFSLEDSMYARWLDGLSESLFERRNFYSFGDEALPLILGSAFAERKFLGARKPLAQLATICIDYMNDTYGTSLESWKRVAYMDDAYEWQKRFEENFSPEKAKRIAESEEYRAQQEALRSIIKTLGDLTSIDPTSGEPK